MDELRDLTAFNPNIAYCMGKFAQHLAFMFVQMANCTLVSRDAFLDYLKLDVKLVEWSAL